MPGSAATRRNIELLTWIRAGAFVGVTAVALASMPVFPAIVTAAIAVGVGLLALVSPPAAVVAFFAITATVVGTADITLGVLLLLAGIASSPWLARDGATRFFLVVGPVLLTMGHAEWAPVAAAGFLLGAGEGAGTAAVACLVLEVVGFALGRPALGVQAAGGTASMLRAFTSGPLPSLSAETLLAQIRGFDSPAMLAGVMQAKNVLLLAMQPVMWGAAAAAAGVVGTQFKKRGLRMAGAGAAAACGTLVVAVGTTVAAWLLNSPAALVLVAITGVVSLIGAEVWLLAWEGFFVREEAAAPGVEESVPPAQAAASPVDALLAQLAVAAGRPGVVAAHSIVLVAEALATPAAGATDPLAGLASILEARGARGTSGRGALVAAFDSESEALAAASEAQRAYVSFADAGSSAGTGVRIAIVAGDTALDIYRRPVGGSALADACAVRTVAGPGQILATAATAAAAPGTPNDPLGQVVVAGATEPLDLVAIRWAEPPAVAPEVPAPVPAEEQPSPAQTPFASDAGPAAPLT